MRESAPSVNEYLSPAALQALLATARAEDMGPDALDVTSQCGIAGDATGTGVIRAREGGTLAGAALLPAIAEVYDARLHVATKHRDGEIVVWGDEIARLDGSLRSLLALERPALNLLSHLSGVATLTGRFVEAIAHTQAKIYDTRKTLPSLRGLEKYAVACGGGHAHRMGLYDAMLIKDNHLAHVPTDQLRATLAEAVARARRDYPGLSFIEIEVDTFDQLQEVLMLDVDIVLLDNMTPHELSQAASMRDEQAPRVQLEASGGVDLDRVAAIADSGVERIAVGALTHSPPAVNIAMDVL